MEPLAFVEIVDRHGDVLARHPVYRWPASIGRGYQADVIIDDAFVAPVHAAIELHKRRLQLFLPADDGFDGFDDLAALDRAGGLAPMLAA